MVAQNHRLLLPDAAQQSGSLMRVNRDAFKVMVGHHLVQLCRIKIGLLQTTF
jgi:hypothetical protein